MGTDRILRRVAIGVVVGCVLVVGVTATAVAVPSVAARLGLASSDEPSYPVGGRVDLPSAVFGTRPLTLIYFARSSCPACQLASPTLAAMAHEVAANENVRVVLVTSPESAKSEAPFARQLGLEDSAIVPLDLTRLKVHSVPTVVLVDRAGTVLMSHEGLPGEPEQAELLRRVTATPN